MAEENNDVIDSTQKNKETAEGTTVEVLEDTEVCFDNTEMEQMVAAIEAKNCLIAESADRYKRLQADFDNFRRRTIKEKEELSSVVAQGVVLELLPVLDNFERAMVSATTQDAECLLAGIEMIYRQFTCSLEKVGLVPVEAIGVQFDPQQHEAVMRMEDADQPDGIIVQELQKGYSVRGRVIRPSMVKVVSNS